MKYFWLTRAVTVTAKYCSNIHKPTAEDGKQTPQPLCSHFFFINFLHSLLHFSLCGGRGSYRFYCCSLNNVTLTGSVSLQPKQTAAAPPRAETKK